MSKSLQIGSVIHSLLSEDQELKKLVGNKIYPLYAKAVNFPFVVYRRSSLLPVKVKFGTVKDEITVEINIVDDNYKHSILIALRIRDILDNKELEDCEINLLDASESYGEENTIIQTLNFKIENNE